MTFKTKMALILGISAGTSTMATAQDVIEQEGYAQNVANYLTENCPTTTEEAANPDNVRTCLDATLTATYSIASNLSDFITEAKVPTAPIRAGMSNGDLLANCETPAQRVHDTDFSTILAQRTAIADFARECIPSIRRSAVNLGLEWESTAVNTVANHVNCLTGNECLNLSGANSPIRIDVSPE